MTYKFKMDEAQIRELAEERAYDEYLAHWDGDVQKTGLALQAWRYGEPLPDDIVIWEPFETHDTVDVLNCIMNSIEGNIRLIKKVLEQE